MTESFSRRLTRYMGGLTEAAHVQGPEETDGDPQFAALCAYLSGHRDLRDEDMIIDVGSGKGIVPHAMTLIEWKNDPPTYVAIDLREPLQILAVPLEIHNNSKKIVYDRFIQGEIKFSQSKNIVILKNLLHELNIGQTGELFRALNSLAPEGTEIYIQDMEQLPSAESRNAPWSRDRLVELLRNLYMEPTRDEVLRSKSKTPWFTIYCRTHKTILSASSVGQLVCDSRIRMSGDLLTEHRQLDERESPEMSLIISRERTTIDVQIADWTSEHPMDGDSLAAHESAELHYGSTPIILKGSGEQLATHVQSAIKNPEYFDIVGILRSKDAIRMAESMRNATKKIWFFGYSNKHAFFDDSNVSSIAERVGAGIDIRILVVDPRSNAARARAEQPAYDDPSDLEADITQSLRRALELKSRYEQWAQVRVTPTVPPCSYFIIDNYCIASFYTAHNTGTSGQSFVIQDTGIAGDFYSLLMGEFLVAYEGALDASAALSRDELI